MKTEPTETLSIKRANIVDKYLPPRDEQRYYERLEMHEELIDLINSYSPKIKQLEWTDHLRHYFVDTPFGVYLILKNHNFEENESWTLYFSSYVIDECIDSDKAQEIAQADFKRRVMKCLDL